MKNNIMRIALVLCLCVVAFAAWDKDKPASSTSMRSSNPQILANWSALETAFGQDHEFSTGGTNSGNHEVITMEEESSAGASSTNELHVQAIDGGSGQPEFAITSEDGNELQMTKDGDLFSSAGLTVTSASTFNGSITLGAGDDLIGSSTSDITFNTNKFTVAGDSGNTVIAGTLSVGGTLDVTGNIDPTTYETTNGGFLNSDTMTGVADNTVASSDSIKNYADSIAPTPDSDDNDSTGSYSFGNGLIIKYGKSNATANDDTTVTFGTPFPNACFQAYAVDGDTDSNDRYQLKSHTITAASFKVRNPDSATRVARWWAIGR